MDVVVSLPGVIVVIPEVAECYIAMLVVIAVLEVVRICKSPFSTTVSVPMHETESVPRHCIGTSVLASLVY